VLDAPRTDQTVGDPFDIVALPFYDKNFKAIMGIEMNMESGNDLVKGLMLHVGQSMFQFPGVVIVHDGDGPYGLLVSCIPLLLDQFIADQVLNGRGPAGISFFCDEGVELLDEGTVDGHAEARYSGHKTSVLLIYKLVTRGIAVVKRYFPPLTGATFLIAVAANMTLTMHGASVSFNHRQRTGRCEKYQ
jgi:hypothetical protein